MNVCQFQNLVFLGCDDYITSCLHHDCQQDNMEHFKLTIIESHYDFEKKSFYTGYTLLQAAAVNNHLDAFQCIFSCSGSSYYGIAYKASIAGHGKAIRESMKYFEGINLKILHYIITTCTPGNLDDDFALLSLACLDGDLNTVINFLLYKEYILTFKDYYGHTALHLSCLSGNLKIVKCLLKRHYDMNIQNNDLNTPLHLACVSGTTDVVEYLVNKMNDDSETKMANIENANGHKPIHIACQYGNKDTTCLLVDMFYQHYNLDDLVDPLHKSFLHHATSEMGDIEVVKYLIEEKHCYPFFQDFKNSTPLHTACKSGKLEITKYITSKLEMGNALSHLNNEGHTPLHEACIHGHLNIVRHLTHECPSIFTDIHSSSDGLTPLHLASALSIRDPHENTPLHLAVCHNQLPVVKYFLENNYYNHDIRGESGRMPLFLAAFNQCTETFDYLLSFYEPQTLMIADDEGETILPYIYKWNRPDIAYSIMNASKYKFITDSYKDLIVLYSAMEGPLKSFKILLELLAHEENITTKMVLLKYRDTTGNTVLHFAISFGNLEVIQFLLREIKLDITICNNNEYSCVDLILGQRQHVVATYFKDWMTFYYENDIQVLHFKKYLEHQILKLLIRCSNIHQVDNIGNTPLHIACHRGDLQIAMFLTDNYKFFTSNHNGYTPLHTACIHGNLDIVKFFSEQKILKSEWQITTHSLNTPLHLAVQNNKVEVVKYIFENYLCDVNLRGEKGKTPLILSAFYNSNETLKYLLNNCPNVDHSLADDDGKTAFWYIYNHDDIDIIYNYISASSYNNTYRRKALLYAAAEKGQCVVLKQICEEATSHHPEKSISDVLSQETDDNGNTVLHLSCKYGRIDVVKYLVNTVNVDLDTLNLEGQTAFFLAVTHDNIEVVEFLSEFATKNFFGADYNLEAPHLLASEQLQQILFHKASRLGLLDIVAYFGGKLKPEVLCSEDRNSLTAFHHACIGGHLDVLKLLHNSNSNIFNIVDNKGYTPLHYACKYGHLDIVQYLTSLKPSDLMKKGNDMNTPLHLATKNDKITIVEYFLENSLYDYNVRGEHGRTALMMAIEYKSIDTLEYLYHDRSECDTHIADKDGKNVLLYLYEKRNFIIINNVVLGSNYEIISNNYASLALLYAAVEEGHFSTFCYILHSMDLKGFYRDAILAHTDNSQNTALHLACKYGRIDTVQYIIEDIHVNPKNKNKNGETCIHLAAQHGQLSIIQYLCCNDENRFCTDSTGSTPLHIACHYGQIDIVKFLSTTKSEKELDKYGRNPLHIASYCGHLNIVDLYIEKYNFDPLYLDHSGLSAFHHACNGKNIDVVRYYAELEVMPTLDHNGMTLLHCACEKGDLKIVQYLTSNYPSQLNCRDNDNNTPLHVAVRFNRTELVHYFLENKMYDSNLKGNYGRTPLHIAAIYKCKDTLNFLISSSFCDLCIESNSGKSAFLLIFLNNYLDIVTKILCKSKYSPECEDLHSKVFLFLAADAEQFQSLKHILLINAIRKKVTKNTFLKMTTEYHSGNTALHVASIFGCSETVQYILDEIKFPSDYLNKERQTCLHLAAKHGQLSVVDYITKNNKCDIFAHDVHGHIPLYYAIKSSHSPLVKHFIEKCGINTETMVDKSCNTPLHLASIVGNEEIVDVLFQNFCKLNVYNTDGNTPLHLACINGNYEVFKLLLTTTEFNIHERNKLGKSVADYAKDNSSMARTVREVYGLEATFIPKVFVIGFSGAGKTTLVSALQKESKFLGSYLKVSKVPPHTVGVTPIQFQSTSYGTVNLYDFAGHEEYHANHQLLFQSSYLPIVLLLVNLHMEDENIVSSIKYWTNILRNSFVTHKGIMKGANIIILGSHYDKIQDDKKIKINNVEKEMEKVFAELENEEIQYNKNLICLDCRKPSSSGIGDLRNLIQSSCLACRAKISRTCSFEESILCQEILTFLNKIALSEILCNLSKICELARSEKLIPNVVENEEQMFEICSKLSLYGKIVLFENSDHHEESWIVFDEKCVLSDFHKSMRHLESTKKEFSDRLKCGLVSLSQLQKLYPENLELILKYLQYSQVCSKIDAESFSIIPQSLLKETYYFFPYLIKQRRPELTPQSDDFMTPFYCWKLESHDSFTPRFLQVLLVQLTLPIPEAGDVVPPNFTVWKNGIHIRNNDTTESIIEVTNPACQFTLAMRCRKQKETSILKRRSQLVRLILSLLEKNCPLIAYEEFLYEPQSEYPVNVDAKKVSLKDIAAAILEGQSTIVTDDYGCIDLTTFLFNDPLLDLSVNTLKRIFLYPNDIIPQSRVQDCQRFLEKIVNKEKFSQILTYRRLHEIMCQHSIFSDRNMWELACIELKPLPLYEIQYNFQLDHSLMQCIKSTDPFVFSLKKGENYCIPFSNSSDEEYCYGHTLVKLEGPSEHNVIDSVIMFNTIKKCHSGTYELRPIHEGWTGMIRFQLIIEIEPEYKFICETTSMISVIEGSSKEIKFIATANPPLTDDTKHEITNISGGMKVPATRRFMVTSDTIVLNDVTQADAGIYQISCTGSNGQIGKKIFELKIYSMPEYTLSNTFVEATEGSCQEIIFSVSSSSVLPVNIKHELCLLSENNVQLPVYNNFKITQNTITLSNVKQEDSGTYQISCTNTDGTTVKAKFILSVTSQCKYITSATTEDTKEIQFLNNNRIMLMKAMTFDMIWLAGEMNRTGLLSDYDHLDVTQAKFPLNEIDKASIMMESLKKKVTLDSKHLNTLVNILKAKIVYNDIIALFKDYHEELDQPPYDDMKEREQESEQLIHDDIVGADEGNEENNKEVIHDDIVDDAGGDEAQYTARTIYIYQAEDDDEISFDVDEIITDIEQLDPGWWIGTRQLDGSHGLFPANYVALI